MSTISSGNTINTAYIVTGDTTGNLVFATGGANTVAFTIDVSQNAVFTALLKMQVYTVAGLPSAGTAGRRALVSNALTPVILTAVVGGGAVTVPVYDNGTTWIVG